MKTVKNSKHKLYTVYVMRLFIIDKFLIYQHEQSNKTNYPHIFYLEMHAKTKKEISISLSIMSAF